MKILTKFKSITLFDQLIKNVKLNYQFIGKNENGKAVYDKTKIMPTLNFTGTVKAHGTHQVHSLS